MVVWLAEWEGLFLRFWDESATVRLEKIRRSVRKPLSVEMRPPSMCNAVSTTYSWLPIVPTCHWSANHRSAWWILFNIWPYSAILINIHPFLTTQWHGTLLHNWKKTAFSRQESSPLQWPGMGSNGVTVMKFLQLLMILKLYLELSYFLSQMLIAVTEVTKVPKFLIWK